MSASAISPPSQPLTGGKTSSCFLRRENTPTREAQAESTATPCESSNSLSRRSSEEKMPTETELEEFFAAAEENLHQQFIDKYNYDTVKDEPVEGRYEWVPIHQTEPKR